METFGIEIILEDPAAEARAELGQLKAMLTDIQADLDRVQKPSLWQRVKQAFVPEAVQNLHEPTATAPNEAAELLASDPLFLDYETTGRNRRTDKVCEVAVIDAAGRVLFSTLVNPQRPIPAEVTTLHGITNAMVADAPTWREVEPVLRKLLAGRVVVAHYADFEAKFTPFDVNLVCSMELANKILGKPTEEWWQIKQDKARLGAGLPARLYQCGLPAAEAHTAAGDSLSTLRLVRYLAGINRPGNIELSY